MPEQLELFQKRMSKEPVNNPYADLIDFGDFGASPWQPYVYKNPADGIQYSFFKSLICMHDYHPWFTGGYDDSVKCSKCGKVKERSPGDYAPW